MDCAVCVQLREEGVQEAYKAIGTRPLPHAWLPPAMNQRLLGAIVAAQRLQHRPTGTTLRTAEQARQYLTAQLAGELQEAEKLADAGDVSDEGLEEAEAELEKMLAVDGVVGPLVVGSVFEYADRILAPSVVDALRTLQLQDSAG